MKKGFTLIELLAVIVILAIIALIATPIVLNIIQDTKESARLRSKEFYLDSVDYAISMRMLNGESVEDGVYDILESGNICIGTVELGTHGDKVCQGEILEITVQGEKPNGDKITIQNGQVVSHTIKYGDVIVDNEEETPELEPEGPVAGLYQTGTDILLKSWDDMLADGDVAVVNGAVSAGNHKISAGDLVFPDNGTVTSIANNGFESQDQLTGITISGSITTIGAMAFRYCRNINTILVEEGVKRIESDAFYLAYYMYGKTTNITLPASLEYCADSFVDYINSYYGYAGSITFAGTVAQWNTIYSYRDEHWIDYNENYFEYPVVCKDGNAKITIIYCLDS